MIQMIPVRASSLAELFDCPARWESKHLLKMRMPSSGAARLGTAIHASTALFDTARLNGSPLTPSESAGALIDTLHAKDDEQGNGEVEWGDTDPNAAEKIGLVLHARYCHDIAPTQDYVGVEVPCEALEITDLGLVLTGTTDRIYRNVDGELGIADLKSGARAVGSDGKAATSGHGPQMGVYELIAEFAVGQQLTAPARIIGLNTGKTAATQKVGLGQIANARDALIGDEDSPGLLQHASHIIHSGQFYGNPKSVLCSAKYCPRHPTCKFKG